MKYLLIALMLAGCDKPSTDHKCDELQLKKFAPYMKECSVAYYKQACFERAVRNFCTKESK